MSETPWPLMPPALDPSRRCIHQAESRCRFYLIHFYTIHHMMSALARIVLKVVIAPVMIQHRVETPEQHLHHSANDDRGIAVRPRQAFLDILRDQHTVNVLHHLRGVEVIAVQWRPQSHHLGLAWMQS